MALSFVFDAPSDEELEEPQVEDDEEEEVDDEEEDGSNEGRVVSKTFLKHAQSPWDFASFSESVAEEHARRSTTSVDFKISKALQKRPVDVFNASDAEDDSSESEIDRQVRNFSYSVLMSI